jgi:hypothetical protein
MRDMSQQNIVPAIAPANRESGGINQATCQHRWAFNRFGGYDYWCQTCLLPGKLATGQPTAPPTGYSESAEAIASFLLGETVVTNDRVLNHALQQAGNIIGRRDISALDKFEMLAAYVLKSRREILGKPED